MTEKQFKFGEKFDRLPVGMRVLTDDGFLDLSRTRVDMVPGNLRGVKVVHFSQKPLYISPDFAGVVTYPGGGLDGLDWMDEEEIDQAKIMYSSNREVVEKPRYIEEDVCSLPKNMRFIFKPYVGYYLDLTETDIVEKLNLDGCKDTILYPKRDQLTNGTAPQVICSHNKTQVVHSKTRTHQ